jgi:hypothetical protein
MNNEFTAHGITIAVCLLALFALSLSHIEVLWGRVKEFFSQFGEDEPDWS